MQDNGHIRSPSLHRIESPKEVVLNYFDGIASYESSAWFITQVGESGLIQGSVERRQQPVRGQPNSHYFYARHQVPLHEDAERYGRLEIRGRGSAVLDLLKQFEPALERLVIIPLNGVPSVHADVGLGRLIPMGLLGSGIQRLFSFILVFQEASGGFVLIDEIENGIHHSKLDDLWATIANLAIEFEVQVFTTTHSYECVQAARDVFSNRDQEALLLRLDRINGEVKAKLLDTVKLETALEANLEIR